MHTYAYVYIYIHIYTYIYIAQRRGAVRVQLLTVRAAAERVGQPQQARPVSSPAPCLGRASRARTHARKITRTCARKAGAVHRYRRLHRPGHSHGGGGVRAGFCQHHRGDCCVLRAACSLLVRWLGGQVPRRHGVTGAAGRCRIRRTGGGSRHSGWSAVSPRALGGACQRWRLAGFPLRVTTR